MNAQVVIEVLREVGGWVAPDELAYQLDRRGERLNEAVIAGLCRGGRVTIDPRGYSLTDQVRRPEPTPAPVPPCPMTPELVTEAMQEDTRVWWTIRELALATGRSEPSVFKATDRLIAAGELAMTKGRRIGRAGKPPRLIALTTKVGALA